MKPRSLLVRYATGLLLAYILCAAEVVAIVVSVSGESVIGARAVLSTTNLIATIAVGLIGTVTIAAGSAAMVIPRQSDMRDRKPAKMTRRQSIILMTPWLLAAIVMLPLNISSGIRVQTLLTSAILFGATATVCTGFLFTRRTLRSLMVIATPDYERAERAPGVRVRLILMWIICSALPGAGIVMLVLLRANGWIIPENTAIETPVLMLTIVAGLLGLRAMILVSSSISDPLHEVVDAMSEVQLGHFHHRIDVYERSELGQLQMGFNRMVAGLREREQLRDLFGRHVGEEVVRRAIDENESLSGDERNVAILFIDLVGSTQLAVTHEPHAVAAVLNEFFRMVVAHVDEHNGLVNKFQLSASVKC